MKKVTSIVCIIGIILIRTNTFSQTTVTLQPDASTGKDAEIWNLSPSNNYGNFPIMRGNAWTWNGNDGIERALIQFDLSSISQGTQIISAQLSLYGGTDSTQYDNGSNATLIQRITSNWDETAVNWNNQPSTSIVNQVALQASVGYFDDYQNIDVTKLVQDMIDNPSNGFGFMIRLQDETIYKRIEFATSDDPNSAKHPKLVITYNVNNQLCKTFKINPEGKDAEVWNLEPSTNFGTYPELKGNAWTWNGTPGIQRALFDFELSSIPINSTIISAQLSLYPDNSDPTQFDSPADGSNSCWLQRITSSWNENTVTWNNQPSTTTDNADSIPMSTTQFESYLNFDVANLVQDMVNDPTHSFGFLLSLGNENYYRRMTFASGDNSDTASFPTLTVCYSISSSVKSVNESITSASLYPNPMDQYSTLLVNGFNEKKYELNIFSLLGQKLRTLTGKTGQALKVDRGELAAGLYIYTLTMDGVPVNEGKLSIK